MNEKEEEEDEEVAEKNTITSSKLIFNWSVYAVYGTVTQKRKEKKDRFQ